MLQVTRYDLPGLRLGESVAERSKMIAWRWMGEVMGVGKAGERRGQKPPGAHATKANAGPILLPASRSHSSLHCSPHSQGLCGGEWEWISGIW